jgi:MFS family permease
MVASRRSSSLKDYLLPVFLMSLCQLLITADLSSASMVLPEVGAEFRVPPTSLAWIVSGYALANAGFMVLGGRITDLFGQRICLTGSLAVFCAGSVLGATAPSFLVLIAARATVGLAGAVLSPASFSLINTAVPEGHLRHRALGFFGMMQGAALIVGLVVPGWLVKVAGWRAVFLLPAPFVILALTLTYLGIEAIPRRGSLRLGNTPSAALITTAIGLLIWVASTFIDASRMSLFTLTMLVVGFALLISFAILERRSRDPLVPRPIVRRRSFLWVCAANISALAGTGPIFIMANLYLQSGLGYTPEKAGLGMIPLAIAALIAGQVGPVLMRRWPMRTVAAAALTMAGCGIAITALSTAFNSYFLTVGVGGGIALFGMNLAIMALLGDATSDLPVEHQGTASGIVIMCQTLGYPIGVASALAALGTSAESKLIPISEFHHAFWIMTAYVVFAVLITTVGTKRRCGSQVAEAA